MKNNDVLLSCASMERIDAAAGEHLGIPGVVLMENAGRAALEAIHDYLPRGAAAPVVFVVGSGNNGGDALVMARWARSFGVDEIVVITSRRDLGATAALQWSILEKAGYSRLIWSEAPLHCREELRRASLVVEGIAGTGLRGPLRGAAREIVELINTLAVPVIAIDVPSGARDGCASGEPVVGATVTVVTGYRKRCLYTSAVRACSGEIRQVDPGFPPLLLENELAQHPEEGLIRRVESGADAAVTFPAIPPDAYKATRGKVGVIGGGAGTGGAPILSGMGALYGGAGMVRVCTGATDMKASRREHDCSPDPSLMVDSDTEKNREEIVTWADALVVGPGWTGASDEDLLQVFVGAAQSGLPLVCDAAALRILGADRPGEARRFLQTDAARGMPEVVLTPHPGELATLAGVSPERIASDPWSILRDLCGDLHAVVVLKSAVTVIATPTGTMWVIDGRCPALGTAGSGDVLAGLLGAYRVRFSETGDAARSAVAMHLAAGRTCAKQQGWFTAMDLARALGAEEMSARASIR